MNIEIVNQGKEEVEFKIDNLTVSEIMSVYLYENGAEFAAWRRDHPYKPLTMKIKGSNVKKLVGESVDALKKDLEKMENLVKKK